MKPLTKREIILAITSLVIVVAAVVYSMTVQQTQSARNESNNASLATQDKQLTELTDYTTTICGEYRKLYDAYKKLSVSTSTTNGYALPGSAKGEVDECYQPQ